MLFQLDEEQQQHNFHSNFQGSQFSPEYNNDEIDSDSDDIIPTVSEKSDGIYMINKKKSNTQRDVAKSLPMQIIYKPDHFQNKMDDDSDVSRSFFFLNFT